VKTHISKVYFLILFHFIFKKISNINILGTNIIDPTPSDSVDPVTATNDALTNLRAVFVKGYDGSLWGRWQVTTREGWGSWVSFGSPSGVGLRRYILYIN